jgi:cytochrome c5
VTPAPSEFRLGPRARRLVVAGAATWAVAFLLAVGITRAQDAPGQDEAERGERIMNRSCQECHDTRRIQVQAKDAEGWAKTVETMMGKGAKIAKEDVPVLLDFLVEHHGPMPDGPGKRIVLNTCTLCHDLKRIQLGRRSSEEWEETLSAMLNEGAPLSDDDFPTVHAYLSRHFGVD